MARVRQIPGTDRFLQAHPLVVATPDEADEITASAWAQDQPLHLEIGCGRGRFVYEAAKAHPDRNYLGLELVPEILRSAIERYSAQEDFPPNLRYAWLHAEHLGDRIAPGSVAHIYLHFSDPWPKNRHEKRRLTYDTFLKIYEQLLDTQGALTLKTDHTDLYTYSLWALTQRKWIVRAASFDYYATDPSDNIATEYERRFVDQGMAIKHILAAPPQAPEWDLPKAHVRA